MNATVSSKRIERLVFCAWCISFQYPWKFYLVIWYNFDMVGYLEMRIKLNYVGCYLKGRWGLLTNLQVSALLTSFKNQRSILWWQGWINSSPTDLCMSFWLMSELEEMHLPVLCVYKQVNHWCSLFSAICMNTSGYSFHCPQNKFCWLTSWLWYLWIPLCILQLLLGDFCQGFKPNCLPLYSNFLALEQSRCSILFWAPTS